MFGQDKRGRFAQQMISSENNAKNFLWKKANKLEKENEKLQARLQDALDKNKKCVTAYSDVLKQLRNSHEEIALHKVMQLNYEDEIKILKNRIKTIKTKNTHPLKSNTHVLNEWDQMMKNMSKQMETFASKHFGEKKQKK
jgi:predicted phage tail protein